MKQEKTRPELLSLNDGLYSAYTVQELEQRLETDPLLLSAGLSSFDGDCKFCSPFSGDEPCDLQICEPYCPGVCLELTLL